MFKAVRDWWFDWRGRRLFGLFAFEFVVVMLGVLAAQGLAEWGEDRAAQRRLDAALDRVRRDAGYNMAAARVWEKAGPCLSERMVVIMRGAAGGTSFQPVELARPQFRLNYFDPLSQSDDLLLRGRGQSEMADVIQQFDSSVTVMAQRLRDVTEMWTAFELLDPANGPILREDRVRARQNASAIRANLMGVALGAQSLVRFGEKIGARPILDADERLPVDCAEIWDSGRTMIVRTKG